MERLPVVAAVLPAFGIALLLLTTAVARWWGRANPSRSAPLLYVAVLGAAVAVAAVHVGGSPAQLGLVAPRLAGTPAGGPWPAVAVTAVLLVGVAAAVAAYLGELWLLSRIGGRDTVTGGRSSRAGESSAMRAVRSWLPSRSGFLAIGLATAVLEELLFRGYLLHGMVGDGRLLLGLLVSAVMFGTVHAPFGLRHVLAKASSGLMWGAAVLLCGTVAVALLAHVGFQLLAARRLWRQAAAAGARAPAGAAIGGGGRVAHRAEPV